MTRISEDQHRRFQEWLLERGGGAAPRDLAVHAVVCRDCTTLASGVDALYGLDLDATPLPERIVVEADVAQRPRTVPVGVQLAAAGAVVLLAGGAVAAANMASGRLPLPPLVGDAISRPTGDVLGGFANLFPAATDERTDSPEPDATPSAAEGATPSRRPEPTVTASGTITSEAAATAEVTPPAQRTAAPQSTAAPTAAPVATATTATPAPPPPTAQPPQPPTPPPSTPAPTPVPTPVGVTIAINDPAPVQEPMVFTGVTQVTFTVSLSAPAPAGGVTVGYTTADGTATAASGDYSPKSGTLSFAPGETSKQISVNVLGDLTLNEPEETFFVQLGSATGATVTDGSGTARIRSST